MADKDGGPVGNQDPSKRGFGKRPDTRGDQPNTRSDPSKRGQKPGHGDVTENPKK